MGSRPVKTGMVSELFLVPGFGLKMGHKFCKFSLKTKVLGLEITIGRICIYIFFSFSSGRLISSDGEKRRRDQGMY